MEPFEKVVDEHGPVVWRVCCAMVGPVDADDVWSETFLAALGAYPDLRPGSNVGGWLTTIAHHKAIDHLRRRQRAATPVAQLDDARPAESLDESFDAELLAALQHLPARQRAAVVHHHIAGLPYAEIGLLLDSSEVAARRSAADGIAALRRTIGTQATSDSTESTSGRARQ